MKLKCKDVVYGLLEGKPELRDNDIKLIQWVWRIESRLNLQLDNCYVYELFLMMQNKKISHPSSIKRARAKLQELHIHLRGDAYNKRHKIQKDTLFDLDTMGAESTGTGY
tara:strand:- start:4166 stop:4495 length:330 start_codon:yes stop_codon:yes gene_type:complete